MLADNNLLLNFSSFLFPAGMIVLISFWFLCYRKIICQRSQITYWNMIVVKKRYTLDKIVVWTWLCPKQATYLNTFLKNQLLHLISIHLSKTLFHCLFKVLTSLVFFFHSNIYKRSVPVSI